MRYTLVTCTNICKQNKNNFGFLFLILFIKTRSAFIHTFKSTIHTHIYDSLVSLTLDSSHERIGPSNFLGISILLFLVTRCGEGSYHPNHGHNYYINVSFSGR